MSRLRIGRRSIGLEVGSVILAFLDGEGIQKWKQDWPLGRAPSVESGVRFRGVHPSIRAATFPKVLGGNAVFALGLCAIERFVSSIHQNIQILYPLQLFPAVAHQTQANGYGNLYPIGTLYPSLLNGVPDPLRDEVRFL